jgi:hypothetical protein
VGVAQWTKASGCGPEDRGFKPLHPPQIYQIVQESIKIDNRFFAFREMFTTRFQSYRSLNNYALIHGLINPCRKKISKDY